LWLKLIMATLGIYDIFFQQLRPAFREIFQCGNEVVHFFIGVVKPETGADHAGEPVKAAMLHVGGETAVVFGGQAEQVMDIGAGAEAAVPDTNTGFVGEGSGHKTMGQAVQVKGEDTHPRDLFRRRSVDGAAGDFLELPVGIGS